MKGEDLLANAQRIVDEEIRDRVVAGIAAIEQAVKDGRVDPDWPDKIDPMELTMSSTRYCVLGQVFAHADPTKEDWERYTEATGYPYDPDEAEGFTKGLAIIDGDVMVRPGEFGFDKVQLNDYGPLQEAWLVALDAR